jgi:hypothetical protein
MTPPSYRRHRFPAFSDDAGGPGPIVREYRGEDPEGTYRVHIEFDITT